MTVIDTGVGIKKNDQQNLFKLFGCLASTDQMNTQGIGLGLVISDNILKAFNGNISFRSKYNKGTKFSFSLELNQCNNESNEEQTNQNPNLVMSSHMVRNSSVHILPTIVEDHSTNRHLTSNASKESRKFSLHQSCS